MNSFFYLLGGIFLPNLELITKLAINSYVKDTITQTYPGSNSACPIDIVVYAESNREDYYICNLFCIYVG